MRVVERSFGRSVGCCRHATSKARIEKKTIRQRNKLYIYFILQPSFGNRLSADLTRSNKINIVQTFSLLMGCIKQIKILPNSDFRKMVFSTFYLFKQQSVFAYLRGFSSTLWMNLFYSLLLFLSFRPLSLLSIILILITVCVHSPSSCPSLFILSKSIF